MGGGGALWLALTRPDVWAAVAPVCAALFPAARTRAQRARRAHAVLPWGADPAVGVESSRPWQRRLLDAGEPVEYIEYPGVRHNAWDFAYRNGGVFDWFASLRRVKSPERVRFVTRPIATIRRTGCASMASRPESRPRSMRVAWARAKPAWKPTAWTVFPSPARSSNFRRWSPSTASPSPRQGRFAPFVREGRRPLAAGRLRARRQAPRRRRPHGGRPFLQAYLCVRDGRATPAPRSWMPAAAPLSAWLRPGPLPPPA